MIVRPQMRTVEELLAAVDEIGPDAMTFELWVPDRLTLNGEQ